YYPEGNNLWEAPHVCLHQNLDNVERGFRVGVNGAVSRLQDTANRRPGVILLRLGPHGIGGGTYFPNSLGPPIPDIFNPSLMVAVVEQAVFSARRGFCETTISEKGLGQGREREVGGLLKCKMTAFRIRGLLGADHPAKVGPCDPIFTQERVSRGLETVRTKRKLVLVGGDVDRVLILAVDSVRDVLWDGILGTTDDKRGVPAKPSRERTNKKCEPIKKRIRTKKLLKNTVVTMNPILIRGLTGVGAINCSEMLIVNRDLQRKSLDEGDGAERISVNRCSGQSVEKVFLGDGTAIYVLAGRVRGVIEAGEQIVELLFCPLGGIGLGTNTKDLQREREKVTPFGS
ncbi:hypothetical protein KEM55_008789, partial [Ascosphaera atra]